MDATTAPEACFAALEAAGAQVALMTDPCILPKACKNETELAAIREGHLQDSVALARFFCWLEESMAGGGAGGAGEGAAPSEWSAAEKISSLRRENPACLGLSFSPISASGPNGAIAHYRVTQGSSRPLSPSEPYLLDSGGQYAGATTDITRTLCFAEPEPGFKRRFTQVLQGHIEVARAVLPEGRSGAVLESARAPVLVARRGGL